MRLSLGDEDEYVGKWPATPEQCGDFIQDDFPLLIRRNFRAVDDPEPMDGRVNRHCKWSHFTDSAFFVPMLIETIHTCAYFIDSDSLMTRATCNLASGRVLADLTAEVEETSDFDRLGKRADRRREFGRGNCGLAHGKLLWILG